MARTTFPELASASASVGAGGSLSLQAWRQGLANRLYGGVNVVVIGSSTTQGLNATALDRRYVDQLGADLHARYNPAGVPGGRHIMGLDSGWTYTGTHGTDANGLSVQSITLAASATMGRTVNPCTSFGVLFAQGPGAGAFTVSVDGGGAVTVTPDTNGTANRHDGVYISPTLTAGSHSILITATAATVISGVYAYNGDETVGVRVYNSGLSGTDAASFSGASQALYQRLAQLSPRLIVGMLGANDYPNGTVPATFRSRLQTIVDRCVGAVTPTPSYLAVGPYARLDTFGAAYPWSSYLNDMATVAAANPTVADYLDISGVYPTTQAADQASLVIDPTDYVHQPDRGHRMMADQIFAALTAPAPATIPVQPFDPRQIGGLLAWYDAGTIGQADNTAVASWTPAAGLEPAPATQATSGNRPVYRTNRVNGRPAVVFASANTQNLDTGTWDGKRSTPLTVVTVCKFATGNAGNLFSGRAGVYVYIGNNSGNAFAIGAGATAEITTTSTQNAWHVLIAVYNGASSALYVDSHTATATGTTTTGTNSALPGLRFGTNSAASGVWLDGEIADLAVFGKACTSYEITALANWYGSRYGVSIS